MRKLRKPDSMLWQAIMNRSKEIGLKKALEIYGFNYEVIYTSTQVKKKQEDNMKKRQLLLQFPEA